MRLRCPPGPPADRTESHAGRPVRPVTARQGRGRKCGRPGRASTGVHGPGGGPAKPSRGRRSAARPVWPSPRRHGSGGRSTRGVRCRRIGRPRLGQPVRWPSRGPSSRRAGAFGVPRPGTRPRRTGVVGRPWPPGSVGACPARMLDRPDRAPAVAQPVPRLPEARRVACPGRSARCRPVGVSPPDARRVRAPVGRPCTAARVAAREALVGHRAPAASRGRSLNHRSGHRRTGVPTGSGGRHPVPPEPAPILRPTSLTRSSLTLRKRPHPHDRRRHPQ